MGEHITGDLPREGWLIITRPNGQVHIIAGSDSAAREAASFEGLETHDRRERGLHLGELGAGIAVGHPYARVAEYLCGQTVRYMLRLKHVGRRVAS